jgi:hypothetical protein
VATIWTLGRVTTMPTASVPNVIGSLAGYKPERLSATGLDQMSLSPLW